LSSQFCHAKLFVWFSTKVFFMIKKCLTTLFLATFSYGASPYPMLVNRINYGSTLGYVNVDSSGLVYVTATANQKLLVYNVDDTQYSTAPYSFPYALGYTPGGIALDSNNNIYIAKSGGGLGTSIYPYSSFSAGFTPAAAFGNGYKGLKYNSSNNLLYSAYYNGAGGSGNIYVYGPTGGSPNFLSTPSTSFAMNAGGLAFDMVYNPQSSKIYASIGLAAGAQVFSNTYVYSTTYGAAWPLSASSGIDVEPTSGYLYSGSSMTFPSDGSSHTSPFVTGLTIPSSSIRVNTSNGKIYAINGNNLSIYFDPFAWTSPGATYLASLHLQKTLTLNTGYNIVMTTGTAGTVAGITNGQSFNSTLGGAITIDNGGTLTLNGGSFTPDPTQGIRFVSSLAQIMDQANSTINCPITISGGGSFNSSVGNVLTINGNMAINSGLSFYSPGRVNLYGNNSGSGGVYLTPIGPMTVGVGGTNPLGTGTVNVFSNSTIQALANNITMPNSFQILGGALTVDTQAYNMIFSDSSGTSTFNGLTKIGSGNLTINSNASGGYLQINNGTLTYAGSNGGFNNWVLNAGNLVLGGSNNSIASVTVNGGSATISGSNTITDNIILNAGSVTLSGNNTFAFAGNPDPYIYTTALNGTVCNISGNNNFTGCTGVNGIFIVGGSFSMSGTNIINTPNGSAFAANTFVESLSIDGTNTFNSQAGATNYFTATTVSLNGTNTFSNGTVIELDGTTITLGGVNMGASTIIMDSGTVNTASDLSLGSSGTTIYLQGSILQPTASFTSLSPYNFIGGTIDTQSYTLSINGSCDFASTLVKTGSGSLILSGNNTDVGGIIINEGTLGIGNPNALGTGSLTMSDGTTLQAASSLSFSNVIIPPLSIWNIDTQSNILAITSNLTFPGTLNKIGSGTLSLLGNNTLGNINVINGTLSTASNSALSTASITMNGGIFQTMGNVTLPNMIMGNAPFIIDTQNNTMTHTGNLIGNATLTKVGNGTLMMNGSNNYLGSINILSGAITLGTNEIWGSVQGSGTLNLGNYLFFMGKDNTNQTFSGKLTGTNIIHKQGTGIITFTGDLSGFTGTIVIEGGEVIINTSTSFGGKIVNNTGASINTKNKTVINGNVVSNGMFITG
jgi:fibronectin-binding autotransporter adhesin